MASIDQTDLLASLQSALGGAGAASAARNLGNAQGTGTQGGNSPDDADGEREARTSRLRACEDLLNA